MQKDKLRDVVVVHIMDGDKDLFIERKKVGRPGLGKRVGVGGGIEEGETPFEALKREVMEEVGMIINSATLMGVVYFIFTEGGESQRCFLFICKNGEYEGTPIETSDAKPEWYLIDQLPTEFMWADNLVWVPEVLKGNEFNGIFRYDKDGLKDWVRTD